MLISSSASKKCKWHIKTMGNIWQPLRPPTTHVTLVQQTIADISKIFFKSSFYCNFERNSLALAFLFLLLFCPFGFPFCPPFVVLPKIRLVLVSVDAKWWDLYAQGGAVEGVLLHCTALLVALVYYRSARMQCASICWTEREESLSGRYYIECNGLGQWTLNFILFRCVSKHLL